ncbi:MAG: hypothetical protein PHS34_01140 [Candidatus Omnitrophica bacterium]|nr:hypothetical protein [Candidatus Omnitrophota bacterium]
MKKIIFILVLWGFCMVLAGCHTVDRLSRFHTGNVGLKDICGSVVADDKDFQETFW